MAYYALLDENNKVVQVITGIDETELIEGKVPEVWYSEFTGFTCKRTSYNTFANTHKDGGTPFRGNYAGIGYTYDSEFDAFIPPKRFPSWKLNYATFQWEAPVPVPPLEEGKEFRWSEPNLEWIAVIEKEEN
jgi:hypothetical protein